MKTALGIIGVLAGIVLVVGGIIGLTLIGTYNGMVGGEQAVNQSWSQVQNVYQRRADLVPNLVATVKGAAQFEQSTLTAITEARASVGKLNISSSQAPTTADELQKFQQAQGQLGSALSRLLVVSENYPQLRATSNFATLQAQLEGTENRISVERRSFTEAVQTYNNKVKGFPGVFLAGVFGFAPKPYFEADQGADKAPKVDFNVSKN